MSSRFGLQERLRSFGFAWRGLAMLVRDEPNARIHLALTFAVVGLAAGVGLSTRGWRWLIVAIAMVWIAESLNTAVERLADATAPDHDPVVGQAKDVAAAGVLVAALAASIIGLTVLVPPIVGLLAARV